jgi:ureidoacrylate peracid hydrolase
MPGELDPIRVRTTDLTKPGAAPLADRDRCAVVVIDLQNDYCHEDGGFARIGYDVSGVQAVVDRVEELIAVAHAHDVPVIFLRTTHGEWSDTQAWAERPRAGSTDPEGRVPLVEDGTWGAELYRLVPGERDRVIVKHRYSGFAYTPLELALRAKGRDTVILVGTTTHICVKATAVDALMCGFYTALVPECTVAPTPALEAASQYDFSDHIGAIVPLAELSSLWAGEGPSRV